MATLSYTDDEDVSASQIEEAFTWNWATWPSKLRTAVIALLIALISSMALLALLRWADTDLTRKLKVQTDLRLAAQSKVKNSDQERRDIEANLPLLRELETLGIFGEEKRLEWIELLRSIEKRWPGIKIQYAISAQKLQPKTAAPGLPPAPIAGAAAGVKLPNGEPAKEFGLFHTDMRLNLNLLHEGDALAILEELKAGKLGHFIVRKCSFKRINNDGFAGTGTNTTFTSRALDSECILTWVSMRAYAPS